MIFEEAYLFGLVPLGLVFLIAASTYLRRRGPITRRSRTMLAVGAALLFFVAVANYLSAPSAGASP